MSLRRQLLALVALTLLLPWAGLRMVQQVEASLRTALERSLLDSARARIVATQLAASDALQQPRQRTPELSAPLYVHSLTRPPLLDGFRSDWSYTRDQSDEAGASRALTLEDGSRLWLGINSGYVYLFIDVVDEEVVYQGVPGEAPYGDRVALLFGRDSDGREALLLANSAPGQFYAQPTGGAPRFVPGSGYYDTAPGVWQDTFNGYAIEARLPVRIIKESFGVGIIDSVDGGTSARLAASTWDDTAEPNSLVRESPELNRILRPFAGGDDRLRILDADGWVLADSGPLDPEVTADTSLSPSIIERLFRYVLRRDDPEYVTHESQPGYIGDPMLRTVLDGKESTVWYRQGAAISAIVVAAVPIDPDDLSRGALVLEQASDPIVTLTNQAMMGVMTTTVFIIVVGSAGLLAYASFLSFRVSRLARAAESALGPRGEINAELPGTKGRDEIGDLSRAFADLLDRLRDYTNYLQSLTSKLSHELRTPLAIVSTSLDNLDHELTAQPGKDYLARLRHGSERLESILQAMTAATRVEQAITQAEIERFDIVAVVASCVSAFKDIYRQQVFEAKLSTEPVFIDGSPELVEQMLDKLVDNAAGFATDGSVIEISLEADSSDVHLAVVNQGPLLPEAMRHQLFDSLVSVRESSGEKPHLGLGLYIVMLVAEFHRGQVEAENLDDGSGVRISVQLSRRDARTT